MKDLKSPFALGASQIELSCEARRQDELHVSFDKVCQTIAPIVTKQVNLYTVNTLN